MRKSFFRWLLKLFGLLQIVVGNTTECPDKIFVVTDKWKDGFRGSVCFKPAADYTNPDPWNVTIQFDTPIENFNAQQALLKVKNVTQSNSTFVVECFPQDCNLENGKVAKFGFMGMFTEDMYDEENEIRLPKTELIWLLGTNRTEVIHDSSVTTTRAPKTAATLNPGDPTEVPTIYDMNGATIEPITEEPELPHDWVQPEPEWAKFKLPFSSPHASKISNLEINYPDAIKKSILFYEAQRSGILPETNRIPWRHDSFLLDLGPMKEKLHGGYFDAGDHMKFTFPMAFSMTMLSWGVLQYWETYESIGELENAVDQIKWGVDWLVKANARENVLFAIVGDPKKDHDYWGRAENYTDFRTGQMVTEGSPGSDVAAEVAAAMAAASLVLTRWGDESIYPKQLQARAELLIDFAASHRRMYHQSVPILAKHYKSSGYKDELVWGAAWVFRATGKKTYFDLAKTWYNEYGMAKAPLGMRFSWDDKTIGAQVLMAQITDDLSLRAKYQSHAESYCNDIQKPSKALYTPGGLVYLDEWGPIRYAMNAAFACLLVSDQSEDIYLARRLHKWSQSQVDYVLGAKLNGFSFMVGFGKKYPLRPHHRGSSCPTNITEVCNYNFAMTKERNPTIIWGAVVGGPDRHDGYKDERLQFRQSEVALDFNAGFQSATAGVLHHLIIGGAKEVYQFQAAPVLAEEEITTTTAPPTTVASSATQNYCFLLCSFFLFNFIAI